MSSLLPYLVAGIVSGSAYALSAIGLTLSYRISRILNFGHGAVAMFCAFAFWQLNVAWGLPTPLALIATMVILPIGLAVVTEFLVFRRLQEASVFARTAATVGLMLSFYGFGVFFWSGKRVSVPSVFPEVFVRVPGMAISGEQIGIVITVAILALGGFLFLRWSSAGLRMRAVIDNQQLAEFRGINVARSSRAAWILSYLFAAISGLLIAPLTGSDPTSLTLLVVYSIVATVLGRMRSLPWTLIGGLALGLLDALAVGYLPEGSLIASARGVVPFALLFAGLAIGGGRFAGRSADGEGGRAAGTSFIADLGKQGGSRQEPQFLGIVAVAGLLVVLHLTVGEYPTYLLATGFAYSVILLSYRALTATTGLISLAQAALAGLGAFVAANLLGAGVPWVVAVAAGGVAAGVVGVLAAMPTIRLRGVFLALATIAFAQLVDKVLFSTGLEGGIARFTGGTYGKAFPRPSILHEDFWYALAVLACFFALALVTELLRRSPVGKELQADASARMGALSVGIRAGYGRLLAFGVASMIAGIGGALLSGISGRVGIEPWNLLNGAVWLAVVAIGGIGSIWGSLIAGILLGVTPEILVRVEQLQRLYVALFGVSALLVLRRPGGLVAVVHSAFAAGNRTRSRAISRPGIRSPAPAPGQAAAHLAASGWAEQPRFIARRAVSPEHRAALRKARAVPIRALAGVGAKARYGERVPTVDR